MPRRIIYGLSLWSFLAAAGCSLAAVLLPSWISYSDRASGVHISYGLTRRCSSLTGACAPFPTSRDCRADNASFCALWRSAGFAMNLALVLQLAALVAYVHVLVGGRSAREKGWRVVAGLLGLIGVVEVVPMAVVAHLYRTDPRFFDGWKLDRSWILCTVGLAALLLDAAGVAAAAAFMAPEDDYEPIEG